jgi:hypothetical protein
MSKKKKRNKPYHKKPDLQKIRLQWQKLTGLHTRDEWSAAVVRAATAAEIAANYAIRKEFERTGLSPEFVDGLLRWANGISGKFDKLLIPLAAEEKAAVLKRLRKTKVQEINDERNAIVHSGRFTGQTAATDIIAKARTVIESVVQMYEPQFVLEWPPPNDASD